MKQTALARWFSRICSSTSLAAFTFWLCASIITGLNSNNNVDFAAASAITASLPWLPKLVHLELQHERDRVRRLAWTLALLRANSDQIIIRLNQSIIRIIATKKTKDNIERDSQKDEFNVLASSFNINQVGLAFALLCVWWTQTASLITTGASVSKSATITIWTHFAL